MLFRSEIFVIVSDKQVITVLFLFGGRVINWGSGLAPVRVVLSLKVVVIWPSSRDALSHYHDGNSPRPPPPTSVWALSVEFLLPPQPNS